MKRLLAISALVVLFSMTVFAANSQNLTVYSPVQVGDKQIPAGEYKVSWTGTGSDVQVSLTKDGSKTPTVTIPAELTEQPHKNSAVSTESINGKSQLKEIQLSKVKLVVKNGQPAAAPTAGN